MKRSNLSNAEKQLWQEVREIYRLFSYEELKKWSKVCLLVRDLLEDLAYGKSIETEE